MFFPGNLVLWHSLLQSPSSSVFMCAPHVRTNKWKVFFWVYLSLFHVMTPVSLFPWKFRFSLWLTKTPLHVYATFSFSLHLLMNTSTHSVSWPFGVELRNHGWAGVCGCQLTTFGYIPRSGVAGWYGGWTHLYTHQPCRRGLPRLATASSDFVLFLYPIFSQSIKNQLSMN